MILRTPRERSVTELQEIARMVRKREEWRGTRQIAYWLNEESASTALFLWQMVQVLGVHQHQIGKVRSQHFSYRARRILRRTRSQTSTPS